MQQLGWFSTGRDKAARDLLTAVNGSILKGEIKAEIAFVFCSREPGESVASDRFLKLADDYDIATICFSYQKFKAGQSTSASEPDTGLPPWRLDYDREVMERLPAFNPDLCVLAGYMLIVGQEMCRRYNMINLHPAAPDGPSGTWQEVIEQLIDNQAQQTGVMMHLVTPELDQGPPLAYCTFAIRGEPFDRYWQEMAELPDNAPQKPAARVTLSKLIRRHELAREFPLIINTLKTFGQGDVRIIDHQVFDATGKPLTGYDLTDEIDEAIKNA